MTGQKGNVAERIFRRLVKLFPFDFRWEHGREMEQDFRRRSKEEERNGGGKMSMLKLWWGTLSDIFRTAPREHLDMLRQDTRYALRSMRKNPGFTVVAVLTLALGIGANTAIFSVVHAVAWGPLPFRDADRLVRLYLVPEGTATQISPRPGVFLAARDRATVFESVAGQQYANLTLTTRSGPQRVSGMYVSERWLRTLGVAPILGRAFTAEEEKQGLGSGVVLISHRLWSTQFGKARGAIGDSITVDERSYTVVGVLPAGFRYPYDNDVWLPVDFRLGAPSSWGMNIQARLRSGGTLEQARAELANLTPQLVRDFPEVSEAETLAPFRTREVLLGDNGELVLLLLAAVGFMLTIVCVNVGSLLLARSHSRRKEFAVRSALGARRSRQVRQLLTESLLLAFAGGLGGLTLAVWGSEILTVLIPGRMANLVGDIPIDLNVLGFTLGATMLTGIVFGLMPALTASRPDLQSLLAAGGRSGGASASRGLLEGLVVAEIALAVILLTGAGLMARNFQRLQDADLGYPADGILTLSVSLESEKFSSPGIRRQFLSQVLERLRAVPSVERAGAVTHFPMDDGTILTGMEFEGVPLEAGQTNLAHYRLVSPEFLEALGPPLLRGRWLTRSDSEGSQSVAVISDSIARRFFPGEDPIGKRYRNLRGGEDARWTTIVGVVGDIREYYDVDTAVYVPYAQDAASRAAAQLVFTVRGSFSAGAVRALREAVWSVEPALAVFDLDPVESQHGEALSEQRLGALLSGSFAGFGLLMAALGTYGVMAFSVGRRTHEIGIRLALGARPRQILRLVLGKGAWLAVVGAALGLAGAFGLTRFLSSLLSEIEATDPFTFAVASVVLVIVALLACYVPARRAMKVDPMVALRYE